MITRVDFQHNRVTLKGVEAAVQIVSAAAASSSDQENGVIAGSLVEEEGQLLPMLAFTVRTGDKTRNVVIDLRYNTLQQGQSRESMKHGMSRITRALALIERRQSRSTTDDEGHEGPDNFDEEAYNDNTEKKEGDIMVRVRVYI
jgi:hypothetical protein